MDPLVVVAFRTAVREELVLRAVVPILPDDGVFVARPVAREEKAEEEPVVARRSLLVLHLAVLHRCTIARVVFVLRGLAYPSHEIAVPIFDRLVLVDVAVLRQPRGNLSHLLLAL